MEIREYQNETINELRKGFANKHQRQVLCLPTGAGKTVVFSELVRIAADRGTQTLVLTDRIELFEQTFKALNRVNVFPQLISANNKVFSPDATINVAMVETLARRLKTELSIIAWLNPQLIIIDEAHKGNFTKIIDSFPNAKIIGATATPIGKHFHKYYTNLVSVIDIPELIELGFLSPCKAFQMQDDLSDLQIASTGDYSDASLNNHFRKTKLYSGVIDEYKNKCDGKKAIVFNCNIEHAKEMAAAFNADGIASDVVTSMTPSDERKRILAAFKNGDITVLNNCGVLTTGYDEPSIEVVIMNRATKSLPLWLQCCGRGSRIYRNKNYFTVLDFGMNHNEHGLWSEPRTWSLSPPKKKKEMQREAPVKNCKQCDAMLSAVARVCTFCGYEFPINENKLSEGVMVEMTPKVPSDLVGKKISELELNDLFELQKSKKYKPTFVWRVVRSKGVDAIKEYATKNGYKHGWIKRQMQDIDNNNFTDYFLK